MTGIEKTVTELEQAQTEFILEARSLFKTYRTGDALLHVLTGVSLSVRAGEFVSIVGASGSGKSTLLHLLGAIDRPTSGEVLIRGVDPAKIKDSEVDSLRNRTLGFVFQFHYLLPEFSAQENIVLPGLMAGDVMRRLQERAATLLEQVGILERANHRPGQLSGGEQQRVAIARALINRPDILLMDEPTGNLDIHSGEELISLIDSIRNAHGLTVVMVTHNLALAAQSDRMVELIDGSLAPHT
ncbi:MAG: ABC transporter ATP-binding protein [bacterium]